MRPSPALSTGTMPKARTDVRLATLRRQLAENRRTASGESMLTWHPGTQAVMRVAARKVVEITAAIAKIEARG